MCLLPINYTCPDQKTCLSWCIFLWHILSVQKCIETIRNLYEKLSWYWPSVYIIHMVKLRGHLRACPCYALEDPLYAYSGKMQKAEYRMMLWVGFVRSFVSKPGGWSESVSRTVGPVDRPVDITLGALSKNTRSIKEYATADTKSQKITPHTSHMS